MGQPHSSKSDSFIVSTKCWEGDWRSTLERIKNNPAYHQGEELWLIVNNMRTDIGEEALACGVTRFVVAEAYIDEAEKHYNVHFDGKARQYSISELVELYMADGVIIHYASDVIPPDDPRWPADAINHLKQYPVVTAGWGGQANPDGLTEFGYTDRSFSDQCYVIDAKTFNPDFNAEHPIRNIFPEHGGDNFECRLAQWLSNTEQDRAILSKYRYYHIPKEDK